MSDADDQKEPQPTRSEEPKPEDGKQFPTDEDLVSWGL